MFLGAVTEAMRAHAESLRRGGAELGELSIALRAGVDSVTWNGPDKGAFDGEARAVLDRIVSCVQSLHSVARELDDESEQQDRASESDDVDGVGAGDFGNGGKDQDNPATLDDMAEEEPYGGTEAEAEENISSRGLEQGGVNDCWYLAALMGIAEHDPDYIREHMWKNDDGTWTVKMYKDGEPVEIVVESAFSPDAANHRVPKRDEHGNVVLGPDGQPEMETVPGGWPAIYEKAAVEYRSRYGDPDYEHIEWGWAEEGYEMLTPHGAEKTGEAGFDDIQERLEKGPVSVASEHPEDEILYPYWEGRIDDNTVVPRHEYNVAGFIPAGEPGPDGSIATEDRIHLENPWGPGGGSLDEVSRSGDLYMTEAEYKENFRGVSSVEMGA